MRYETGRTGDPDEKPRNAIGIPKIKSTSEEVFLPLHNETSTPIDSKRTHDFGKPAENEKSGLQASYGKELKANNDQFCKQTQDDAPTPISNERAKEIPMFNATKKNDVGSGRKYEDEIVTESLAGNVLNEEAFIDAEIREEGFDKQSTESVPRFTYKIPAKTRAISINGVRQFNLNEKDLQVVDVNDITRNHIKWFGIKTENGSTLTSAAVFGEHFSDESIFDYLNLSPLDGKSRPNSPNGIPLEAGLVDIPGNDEITFSFVVKRVTGEGFYYGNNKKAIMDYIYRDEEHEKIPLLISGHGGKNAYNAWGVGTKNGTSVNMNMFLKDLGGILSSINPNITDNLRERYSIAILDICNDGFTIPQKVVDKMGIPVAYSKSIVSMKRSTSEAMHLVLPSDNKA